MEAIASAVPRVRAAGEEKGIPKGEERGAATMGEEAGATIAGEADDGRGWTSLAMEGVLMGESIDGEAAARDGGVHCGDGTAWSGDKESGAGGCGKAEDVLSPDFGACSRMVGAGGSTMPDTGS